ncbi:MAG: hypothetical protein PVJ80_02535 [Gemmatimonadota bacterium]|jgi:hypothetical protein
MIADARSLLVLGTVAALLPAGGHAQTRAQLWPHAAVLEREYPETHALLLRLERAHGVALGRLGEQGSAVSRVAADEPTPGFEAELVRRLIALVDDAGTAADMSVEAEIGYSMLGRRGGAVVAWGRAFQREVFGILVDPAVDDRRAALAEAVERYRSRPEVALPSAPKDMDIVYDHAQTFAFRTRYPELSGFLWAGLWFRLAATEPLTDFDTRAERAAGLDTVAQRYLAKLGYGEPPQSLPSQIPLAPAIAPGLIFASPESAMIWDNLSLMEEVLADILASPDVEHRREAVDEMVGFFVDSESRVTDRGTWEHMALTHGIFFQGGYPLAPMTRSELNGDGHAAHIRNGGAGQPMPVVPND